ncbi:tubulin-specific chaperone cofactor E-like protein isoform X4 [Dendronephthya gigantea]|uniref:tubulin-specific chaperone cofactor E-like protein isoform X4 n=1 Tax=Dendronephthya gigantea TaxID=151771 RepID=UPI00106931E9|nr:tubulin-specific chaperone cofactor E-like protein isoform X4 [Dendronephthya gigantea]
MEKPNGNDVPLVSLVEALNLKYSDENCAVDDFAHIYVSSRVKEKTKGQAMFPHEKREIVALDCCGISVAGKPGEIASVCPRVTDLDLTDNHIKDWKEVSMILNELKFLHFLNLCGNHLNDSTYSPNGVHSSAFQSGCFAALSKLVLNNTKVSLCTVQRFLKSLPSLIELHLSLNDYSSVPECDKCCTTVKRLHFNGNKIQHWNEVEKLGKMFPYLETLIIMENPLSNVERSCQDVSFLDLKCLSLTKTKLDSWEHIEALRKFENLNQVKLMGIPLLAKYEQDESRRYLQGICKEIWKFWQGNIFGKKDFLASQKEIW